MNILFLSRDYHPHQIGGVGVYVYEMSKLLAKMGHKTYVITIAGENPVDYIDEGVRIFRVKPRKIRIWDVIRSELGGTLERLEYSLAVSGKIKEVVSKYKVDLIESCEARAEGFWYYLFRKKPPLVIKLHTPETAAFKLDHAPKTLDYFLTKILEEFWINKAAQRIGLSEAVVKLTARHFSMKLINVPLLPNPIDIELLKPAFSTYENNSLEILYVGRLEFRKGVHTLIRAFKDVQQNVPQAELTFIGANCGMKDYLLSKTLQLEYPEKVKFIEELPRNRLVEYYQRSTVCVVPSIWENYPYTCLEAMACGKPVIACDTGGLKDIITHRFNGILFPPESSQALSEAIVALLKDSRQRKILGLNARKTIEEKHSPEKVAQKTIYIYQNILNKFK